MKNILLLGAFLIIVATMLLFVLETDTSEAPTPVDISSEMLDENEELDVYEDPIEDKSQQPTQEDTASTELARRGAPEVATPSAPLSKLKVANFTGKLEKVDVGCFADGECFVEVDGKHVTVIMGWSQETVGQVLGVDGFGDLESHIGKSIEVYAQDTGDGKYTLYGNEGFYIKLQ